MAGAYIRGTALACALGMDADACVSAMSAGSAAPHTLDIAGFNEPQRLSYYRIPDGGALFDPGRFERLLPPLVQSAVRQAGLGREDIRTLPVFVGSSCFSVGQAEAAYQAALTSDAAAAVPMPLCDYDFPAQIARRALGGTGESWAFNTACSSSANALLGALRLLETGACRHALVLGVELANHVTLMGFTGLQVLADAVKPFDAGRRGMVLGEGLGAIVLSAEPAAGAPRLLGGANNCDAYSVTAANPDGSSVVAVLYQALAQAGADVSAVRAVKAHGTGSGSGDQAEAAGLARVFEELPVLTALKPYIGHTLGACGVVELVLYAGALGRGQLPATLGFEAPDPALGLRPSITPAAAPAGLHLLNHFGFGGNNTVLVLEKPA